MKTTPKFIGFLFTAIVMVLIIMPEDVTAQLAKIHRKTATLEAAPAIVIHGQSVAVTVQVWEEREAWRVAAITSKGDIVLQQTLTGAGPVLSQILEIPEPNRGEIRIVLEGKQAGRWNPVTEQRCMLIPDFYEKLCGFRASIEETERQAPADSARLRSCWAALAYIEDLLERAKVDGNTWDIMRRLQTAENYSQALAKGDDPFADRTGYILRGYRSELNGGIQLYSQYTPKEYDANKPWPLVIMLHGAWSNHHLGLRRVMGHSNNRAEDDPAAKRSMPELPDVPYLVVAPNGFETMSYEGFAEEDVWRVLAEVSSLYNVDEDRVYLTGLSMGGAGTGKLGIRNMDRFAAIAPVCGFFGDVWDDPNQKFPDYQQRMKDISAVHNVAENLLHVPVKIMHGDADPVVPPQASRDLYARLRELGYNASLEMYPGVQHDAWVPAYKDAGIFEWFGQFKRDPYPKKVIYKTGNSYGGSAYWLSVDELETIRYFASVKAEAKGNAVEASCENVERLTLRLAQELFSSGGNVEIKINGEAVKPQTIP